MTKRKKESCFIAMHFTEELFSIYKMIYKPVVEKHGMEAVTAERVPHSGNILSHMYKYIKEANLIIADLTHNSPNVLYELGLAHSLSKNVIVTTQNIRELPFDVGVLRAIPYKNNAEGLAKLEEELESRINSKEIFFSSFIRDEEDIIYPEEISDKIAIYGKRIFLLDRNSLIDTCSLLAERAKNSYWGMGRQIAWIKNPHFKRSIKTAIENNIEIRMMSFSEGESNWYVKEWKTLGVPVKYSDHGYLRLVIADRKAVVYGIPYEVKKIKTNRDYCGELIQGKYQEEIIDSWVRYYIELWKKGATTPKELEESIVGRIEKSMENKKVPRDLDMIQWIFFDLDKTLYINKELSNKYEEAVIDLIGLKKRMGPEEAEEEYGEISEKLWISNGYHPTILQIVAECGVSPKELAVYIDDGINPFDYINMDRELIEKFRSLSSKFKLGVVTNNTFKQAKSILEAIGIGEFVQAKYIFACDDIEYHKPDPQLYNYLIDELNVSSSQCLVIGNRKYVDLEPAKQIGIKTCEVDDPTELLEILEKVL